MYSSIFLFSSVFLFLKEKRAQFIVLTIVLFLLSALRFGVGPDYFSYQFLYQQLEPNVLDEIAFGIGNQELLFRIIGSLLKGLGFSYQAYLALFAAVNVYFVAKISHEFSSRPSWSMFFYYSFFYFVWTFSGIRQGITIAIGCYYYLKCKEEKNMIKFSIIVILLTGIHSSSIILLFFYIITNFQWNKNKLIFISLISLLVSVLPMGNLFNLLQNISFFKRLGYYVPTSFSLLDSFDIQSLARLVFLGIGIAYYNSFTEKKSQNKEIMNLFIIGLNMYFVLKFSELVAARISIYGFYMLILVLPDIYNTYEKLINKIIFRIVLIMFCLLYFNKEIGFMKESSNLVINDIQSSTLPSIFTPYTNISNENKGYYFDTRYNDLLIFD